MGSTKLVLMLCCLQRSGLRMCCQGHGLKEPHQPATSRWLLALPAAALPRLRCLRVLMLPDVTQQLASRLVWPSAAKLLPRALTRRFRLQSLQQCFLAEATARRWIILTVAGSSSGLHIRCRGVSQGKLHRLRQALCCNGHPL